MIHYVDRYRVRVRVVIVEEVRQELVFADTIDFGEVANAWSVRGRSPPLAGGWCYCFLRHSKMHEHEKQVLSGSRPVSCAWVRCGHWAQIQPSCLLSSIACNQSQSDGTGQRVGAMKH